jgi:hypothetical protein
MVSAKQLWGLVTLLEGTCMCAVIYGGPNWGGGGCIVPARQLRGLVTLLEGTCICALRHFEAETTVICG